MIQLLKGTFTDKRDEIALLILAIAIPLATLPAMI
jgi:hypothetical protein